MSKYEWDLGEIKIAVKESINFTEVLDKIGVPRQGNNSKTLKNILTNIKRTWIGWCKETFNVNE